MQRATVTLNTRNTLVAWFAVLGTLLAAAAVPQAAVAGVALRKEAAESSRWSALASVDASRCLDTGKTTACSPSSTSGPTSPAAAPAKVGDIETIASLNIAYALSKRLSLGVTAASRVDGTGMLDPILDVSTTLPWSKTLLQQVSLDIALPGSKESRDAHLISQETLTLGLCGTARRLAFGVSVFLSRSSYGADPASAGNAAPPPPSAALFDAAGPAAGTAADPGATAAPQQLSQQGAAMFGFFPISRSLAVRSAAMVSEGVYGPGASLWITAVDVANLGYTRGNTTLSSGLELVHAGAKIGTPDTLALKAGVQVQFGGGNGMRR